MCPLASVALSPNPKVSHYGYAFLCIAGFKHRNDLCASDTCKEKLLQAVASVTTTPCVRQAEGRAIWLNYPYATMLKDTRAFLGVGLEELIYPLTSEASRIWIGSICDRSAKCFLFESLGKTPSASILKLREAENLKP